MNDIYKQRSNLKMFLIIMGALILVVTIVYSNFLAEQLKISEERNSRLAKEAFDFINNNQNYDIDITFYQNVKDSLALPMIILKTHPLINLRSMFSMAFPNHYECSIVRIYQN